MKKKWIVKKGLSKEVLDSFPDINPITLQLLFNRDIKDKEKIKNFL